MNLQSAETNSMFKKESMTACGCRPLEGGRENVFNRHEKTEKLPEF